jgi:hypothetical protein
MGFEMSITKKVVEDDGSIALNLSALANIVFTAGVIASIADALLTWLVIRKVGMQIEGNGIMRTAMVHLGLIPVLILRVVVGVNCFWGFTRLIRGQRFFLTNWGARRYRARLVRTRSPWRQKLWDSRHYFLACEVMFGIVATWAVVGNNLRAYLTLVH